MKYNDEYQAVTEYVHHDTKVKVIATNKGKHRLFGLCHNNCKFFIPDDRLANCNLANELFAFDVAHGMTTPVWTCPKFEKA